MHTTLCRELSAVPSGLSLCRAQSVTLLVAPEALNGVPCLLCARESGARLCLMMARHQEPHDGTVATNFGIPDESRLRLTAPSRSSTPTSLDVVGLDDSTRPAVAAACEIPGTHTRTRDSTSALASSPTPMQIEQAELIHSLSPPPCIPQQLSSGQPMHWFTRSRQLQ